MTNYKKTCVRIPEYTWQTAKKRGINISGFLANQLNTYLEITEPDNYQETQLEKARETIDNFMQNKEDKTVGALYVKQICDTYGISYPELKDYCDEKEYTVL